MTVFSLSVSPEGPLLGLEEFYSPFSSSTLSISSLFLMIISFIHESSISAFLDGSAYVVLTLSFKSPSASAIPALFKPSLKVFSSLIFFISELKRFLT